MWQRATHFLLVHLLAAGLASAGALSASPGAACEKGGQQVGAAQAAPASGCCCVRHSAGCSMACCKLPTREQPAPQPSRSAPERNTLHVLWSSSPTLSGAASAVYTAALAERVLDGSAHSTLQAEHVRLQV